MSVSQLYWRQLEFDNTKHMSFTFHNFSPVINSEVLICIIKAEDPEPTNDSSYFTLPSLAYRADIRTEPGDRVYYTTRNGGEFSYHSGEINETHNYEIPTTHERVIVSGEYVLDIPEGSMVSLQSDPESNDPDSYLVYKIGDRGSSTSGTFRLYGAQQVAYTFTKATTITFIGDEYAINYLITASQNVSQLSKEMQDKIDKLVADLEAAMENMATKDMLNAVNAKTKRDYFTLLPAQTINRNYITTGYFYNKFADTEQEVSNEDVITASIGINIISYDQDIIKDAEGVVTIAFKYMEGGCEVISFTSTNPELTKLTKLGTFTLNKSIPTEDINTKWQRMEIKLNIKSEYSSLIEGSSIAYVKSNMVPLQKESIIIFDDSLNSIFDLEYEHLYQNFVFMTNIDVANIIESLVLPKQEFDSSYNISEVLKDVNEFMLDRYTITTTSTGTLVFSFTNDAVYKMNLKLLKGEYPVVSGKELKPVIIEVFEDTIEGLSFLFNIPLVGENPSISNTTEHIEYTTTLNPVPKREYEYIESMLTFIMNIGSLDNIRMRVVYNE